MTPRMIVVTGGAGFIGSNIVARLTAETAYDVVVCDRLETADLAKWKNLAKHSIADFWAAPATTPTPGAMPSGSRPWCTWAPSRPRPNRTRT